MSRNIEEAFNECFERLLSGESLDSCLRSYPQYAVELDSMLRTAFDVKRKAFPVQPRPEFRYWSRVRMQGIQQAGARQQASGHAGSYNMRRNLAISLAAILVFVLASSGTAAASSEAMPDQPLYEVKLAVEQVTLTLTSSDIAKAELYANMAEKRATEIAVMASQGKTDKVLATTTRMYDQLDKAEQLLANIEAAGNEASVSAPVLQPNITVPRVPAVPAAVPAVPAANPPAPIKITPSTLPAITSNQTEQSGLATGSSSGQTDNQSDTKSERHPSRTTAAALKAKNNFDASTAKTLTILQDALDKAPDSVKPSLSAIIEHTRTSNARFNRQFTGPETTDTSSDNTTGGTDNHLPVKPKFTPPPAVVPSDNTSKVRGNNRFITHHGNTSDNGGDNTDDSTDSDNATMIDSPATTAVSTVVNDSTAVTTPTSSSVTVKQTGTSPTVHNFTPFTHSPTRKFNDQTNTSK
jgi:hypothetical protein